MNHSNYVAEKGVDYDGDDTRYFDTVSSLQNQPYVKQLSIKNTSSNPIKEKEKHLENGDVGEENHDTLISMLFNDARDKLEKIDAHEKQQKKQIVVELAKSLEGIIPTDVICMKIINKLLGRVSERFIRECLDEKYKQKPRIENARKQKKQHYLEDKEGIEKLAAVTPLNQSLENDKIILVAAHGEQELSQSEVENNEKPYSEMDTNSTEENIKSLPHKLSYQKEIEQQLGPKNKPIIPNECPSCIELSYKNNQLREALGKLNQFTSADKMKNAKDANKDVNTANNIVDFEFCEPLGELCNYLESLFQLGNSESVWFSGKIDTSTGKVVSSGYGRTRQNKKQEPLSREIIDDDDDWEDVE